jgi:hypothetical protein
MQTDRNKKQLPFEKRTETGSKLFVGEEDGCGSCPTQLQRSKRLEKIVIRWYQEFQEMW